MNYYSLKPLQPIALPDLVRVGRNCDGGYVLSRSQVERTEVLLSFGICDDWSFEADFLSRMPQTILHAYDYSVSPKFYAKNMLRHYMRARFEIANHYAKCLLCFGKFFNPKRQRYFHKKFVSVCSSATDIGVADIFASHVGAAAQTSIFVKMDIESAEYAVLPLFEPHFAAINGFAIEFHRMDIASAAFEDTLRLLGRSFYVAHVHANNCGGYIAGTALPAVLEITFINIALVNGAIMHSAVPYPLPALDYPCDPRKADMPLRFE
jgi:hypothetical protein